MRKILQPPRIGFADRHDQMTDVRIRMMSDIRDRRIEWFAAYPTAVI